MNPDSRIERHFIYVIIIAWFLLGLLLVIISRVITRGLLSSVLEGIGVAFCTSGVIAFVFEYYFQERWIRSLQIMFKPEMIAKAEMLGIKNIFADRGEWERYCGGRLRLYREAEEIWILAEAPNLPPPYNDEVMVREFLALLQEGKKFRVLVCDPEYPFNSDNPVWHRYSVLLNRNTQYESDPLFIESKEEKKNSLKMLDRIRRTSLERGYRGSFEVRVYDVSPGCYLQRIDDRVFVESYIYHSGPPAPIMLEMYEPNRTGIFHTHFRCIWRRATLIEDYLISETR